MATSPKTVPTDSSVAEFVASLPDQSVRTDCATLIDVMRRVSGHEPQMWGPSIIGFDSYHYRYASGREGDAAVIGFSPRVGKLSIYLVDGTEAHAEALASLGAHTTAKVCLYLKRLADVDLSVLETILRDSYRRTRGSYAS